MMSDSNSAQSESSESADSSDSKPSWQDFDASVLGSIVPSDASHLGSTADHKRSRKGVTRPQNSLTKVMFLLLKTQI
jgi:hypothetical protein